MRLVGEAITRPLVEDKAEEPITFDEADGTGATEVWLLLQ